MPADFVLDGTRLRQLRLDAGLTIAELAEAAGIGPNTLSQYENGRRFPAAGRLAAVCAVLGVTVEAVLVPADEHDRRLAQIINEAPRLGPAQRARIAAIITGGDRRKAAG